jgi:CO/xanthine dehydrogenase Mo-binding subunit
VATAVRLPADFVDLRLLGTLRRGRRTGLKGWIDMPFDIPNLRAENGPAQNHVRIGWLRSVANIYHAFAVQSFIDELASAAGRDRIEYFLDVLGRPRTIDTGVSLVM